MTPLLRIGTRGSELARWQATHVADALRHLGGVATELVVVRTRGDTDRSRPLVELGGSGVFTRELQHALSRGEVDLVVHSLKDLPVEEPPGLVLAAVLARDEPREVLVAARHAAGPGGLGLKPGAVVGTSSPRRAAQALAMQPDITVVPLRGNVPTRLRRLDEGVVDAVILAYAGIRRLGCDLAGRLVTVFAVDTFVPAPGQGALAVETREDGGVGQRLVSRLNDPAVAAATRCERELLRRLGGGCHLPLGAYASYQAGALQLVAALGEADEGGRWAAVRRVRVSGTDPERTAEAARRALDGEPRP